MHRNGWSHLQRVDLLALKISYVLWFWTQGPCWRLKVQKHFKAAMHLPTYGNPWLLVYLQDAIEYFWQFIRRPFEVNTINTVLFCSAAKKKMTFADSDVTLTYCKKLGMGLLPKFSWDPIIMEKNIKGFFFHPFQQWQNLSLLRTLTLEF